MTASALETFLAEYGEDTDTTEGDPATPFIVMAYYGREHRGEDGVSHEVYSTSDTEDEALQLALEASQRDQHEYAIEGGHYEPGTWENPVFRGGVRLR